MNEIEIPETLRRVETRPLFVMRLAVRAPFFVAVDRRIGVITGGVVTGDRISGEVLDGGSDWQTIRQDGATLLDVRTSLKTSDGALIAMTYRGVRHGPADVLAKLDKGETVDPASYYFRTSLSFETADPRYEWLTRVVAIGIGHRLADGPIYSVFEVQ